LCAWVLQSESRTGVYSYVAVSASTSFISETAGGVEPNPLLLRPILAKCTSPRWWLDEYEAICRVSGRRNRSTRTKNRLSAALSTTNPTLPDVGSNQGRRGGKQDTTGLSYGTVHWFSLHPVLGIEFARWIQQSQPDRRGESYPTDETQNIVPFHMGHTGLNTLYTQILQQMYKFL
jgi:hypothetical protein